MRRQAGGSVGGELVEAGFGGGWIRGSGGGGDLHHGGAIQIQPSPYPGPVWVFFSFFCLFSSINHGGHISPAAVNLPFTVASGPRRTALPAAQNLKRPPRIRFV